MQTVKLGSHRDVHLEFPEEVTRQLKVRKGTTLEVLYLRDGIFLVPRGRISRDRRYFYTKEWQAKEREADEDIRKGRVKKFCDVEKLLRDLKS